MEEEEQVVVQVVGLGAPGWDAMDVDSHEMGRSVDLEGNSCFFNDFPASGIRDGGVGRLHVTTRGQPAVEAAMVDQEEPGGVRGQDQARAGDVSGRKVAAGKRLRSGGQQLQHLIATLESFLVRRSVETAHERSDGRGIDHALYRAPKCVTSFSFSAQ